MNQIDLDSIDFDEESVVGFLKVLGLTPSCKTGGYLPDNYSGPQVEYDSKKLCYKLKKYKGNDLFFYDGSIFLKSLKVTEKSLNLRLFV